LAAICSLGHFFFCPDLRTSAAFSTILPFYLAFGSLFLRPQNLHLASKMPLFNDYFALLSHVFNGSKGFYLGSSVKCVDEEFCF